MRRQVPTWFIIALSSATSTCMVLSLAIGLTAFADDSELDSTHRMIPYNGILEFNGQTLNGNADIQFTLATDDGTCAQDFVEPHEDVPVYAGRFSVNIGSVIGEVPDCLFDASAVHLQMAVRRGDDDTDHILLAGRQRINPVPFAYWSAEGSDFRVDGTLTSDAVSTNSANVTGNLSAGAYTPEYADWSAHGHGAGNAAIYNDDNTYKSLMIVGNSSDDGATRKVSLWDDVSVNQDLTVGDDISADNATITSNITAGSANVTGNTTSNSANVTGNITADNATITRQISADAWTPAYSTWNEHGTGAGGAAIYNENSVNGLMIVGNGTSPNRQVGLWDNVTVHGNLNVVRNVWNGTATTTGYGNGAHSQGHTHTNRIGSPRCPNGTYMVGINVIHGFHTNDNSSVAEIQVVCHAL